ncbi:MAG: hypothetical protein HY818_03850 [Acetobacterium woodii]|nr:hypothetical protein [Acetobacterium woodii]
MGIGGPFVINYAYSTTYKVIFTIWNPQDILTYYGTILGAVATIIAVIWTIKTTKESAEEDRLVSTENIIRDYGIKICIDFVETCSFTKIQNVVHDQLNSKIENTEEYDFDFKLKFDMLCNSIEEMYMKFDFYFIKYELEKEKIKKLKIKFIKYISDVSEILLNYKGCEECKEYEKCEERKKYEEYEEYEEYLEGEKGAKIFRESVNNSKEEIYSEEESSENESYFCKIYEKKVDDFLDNYEKAYEELKNLLYSFVRSK